MRLLARIALAVAALAWVASAADTTLTWRGKKLDLAALPPELPADARVAVESFSAWAAEHDYRLDLDTSARALVVSAKDGAKWVKRAEAVLALADETFDGRAGAASNEEPSGTATASPVAWGSGARVPNTGTFVLAVVRTPKDHPALLARLAELSPYLASWAKGSTPTPGFALEEPLAGAVVLGLPENKEWNADNEFVHRAAELAFHRRFGRQPYWMLQGFAWHAEQSLCRGIYCFPYRTGFVRAGEHTGWRARLGKLWREKPEPKLTELATLRRGSFEDVAALQAWGTMAYLCEHSGPALDTAMRELHELWEKNSRRDLGGGAWERVPEYEIPVPEQEQVFLKHVPADSLARIRAWFVGT